MGPTSIVALIVVGVVILGSLLQTYKVFPSFLDKVFDIAAFKLTVGVVLLLASAALLLLFLKGLRNREGFQSKTSMDTWKELVDTYQVEKVCALKKRLEEKVFLSIRGGPPDQLSDVQARERTEKLLNEGTSHGTINCALLDKTLAAKDIDSFFVPIQELPSTFLIQNYDTVQRIRNLLKNQVGELDASLAKQSKMATEGFIDPSVGICSAEIVEERRKFLRQKKLDDTAQRCLLPEEVPFESKEKLAITAITKLSDTYLKYIGMRPAAPTIDTLLNECLNFEARLNKSQQDAQSGTLLTKG